MEYILYIETGLYPSYIHHFLQSSGPNPNFETMGGPSQEISEKKWIQKGQKTYSDLPGISQLQESLGGKKR